MNVAIYARQSLDKKDSMSIEAQVNLCKKECNAFKNHIHIFADKGFSGKNTRRPDFEKMMEAVKAGNIDRVIVYRLDRLSRSIVDFANMWTVFDTYSVTFTSVNEKFDTTSPMGRTMIYIIMIFAQLERETIGERVRDNYYERIKYGTWPGGPAPYGYKNGSYVTPEGRKVPTLIPDEQIHIVKRIFNMYSEDNASLGSIAKQLSAEGIPSAKRDTWDNVSVSRILRSPIYVKCDIDIYSYYKNKGVILFSNDIEDYDGTSSVMLLGKRLASSRKYTDVRNHTLALTNFQGVIPSDVWLACQNRLDRNTKLKNSGAGRNSWLTGLIKCMKCGYAIVIKKSRDKFIFACSGRYNLHICDVKSIPIDTTEVEYEVQAQLEKILEQCSHEEVSNISSSIEHKKRLIIIEDKIDKLLKCITESNDITIQYLNKEIEKLDAERKKLLDEMELKNRLAGEKYAGIVFSELSLNEKHMIAESFIERILISGYVVDIIWKV